jgi:tetratricopeptide (TPR) repeat protein
MSDATQDLLLVILLALTVLVSWLASRRQKKQVRTIKCQLCHYVGPATYRWKPFHARTPSCRQCNSADVLVVKVIEDSSGETKTIWADGRHCPACNVDIGLLAIVRAGLPQRIRCPECGLRLKYADCGSVALLWLALPAPLLVILISVFWFIPYKLVPPFFSAAIVVVLSASIALLALLSELGMAHYLRDQRTLIRAEDDASAQYILSEDRPERRRTVHCVGRRRLWIWGSLGILTGVILWGLCGIIWFRHTQQLRAEARIHYGRAVAKANSGEREKAINDLGEAIRLDPTFVTALVGRANLYAKKHQLDKAMADCTDAIRIEPKCAPAYECRAAVHNFRSDYDKAILDANEAVRLDPTVADAYLSRGLAYYEKDQWDKAISDLTSAVDLNPKSAVAYYLRGRCYYVNGELSKATADFTDAIRLDPKEPLAYCGRSLAYRKRGELDKAMFDCMEAIRINPKCAIAYSRRAAVHISRGQYDKAIADSNEALGLDPKMPFAFAYRGMAYSKKGEFDKAMADFDEGLRLHPKLQIAYYARGSSYIDQLARQGTGRSGIGNKEYTKAVADLSEAIKLLPKDADAYEKRASAYRALGEEARAQRDEKQAKELQKRWGQ